MTISNPQAVYTGLLALAAFSIGALWGFRWAAMFFRDKLWSLLEMEHKALISEVARMIRETAPVKPATRDCKNCDGSGQVRGVGGNAWQRCNQCGGKGYIITD